MARVKVKAIRDGVWQSPQGPVPVDQTRLKHWSSQFKKMREAGLNIPISWGHSIAAVPNKADQTFLAARLNAGYIENMDTDGKSLDLHADAPGMTLDGNKLVSVAKLPDTGLPVTTAIKEVSLGIANKFIDGSGRVWDDVITHLAVTPHPVVNGQDGFQQLGTVQEFQTIQIDAQWLEHEMEEPPEPKEPKEPKSPKEPKEPKGKGEGTKYSFDVLLNDLHELGIALPDDTKPDESGWERLWVAVTALKNRGGLTSSVTEERPEHLMMALEKSNPEAFKALKAARQRADEYERKDRERRWKDAQKRLEAMSLPKSVVDARFLSLTHQNLSLDALDENTLKLIERDIELVESIWSSDFSRLVTQLSLGTEAENPLTTIHEKMKQEADGHMSDMIRMATGKAPEANGVKK